MAVYRVLQASIGEDVDVISSSKAFPLWHRRVFVGPRIREFMDQHVRSCAFRCFCNELLCLLLRFFASYVGLALDPKSVLGFFA